MCVIFQNEMPCCSALASSEIIMLMLHAQPRGNVRLGLIITAGAYVGNVRKYRARAGRRTHPRELCPPCTLAAGGLPASADCALALRRLAWELKIKCKEVKP